MSGLTTIDSMSELTGEMLHHAQRAEWSTVAALESERSRLMVQLAEFPAARENVQIMRDVLHRMVEVNEQIRALASAARLECGAALVSACTSTRLAQTYGADE